MELVIARTPGTRGSLFMIGRSYRGKERLSRLLACLADRAFRTFERWLEGSSLLPLRGDTAQLRLGGESSGNAISMMCFIAQNFL